MSTNINKKILALFSGQEQYLTTPKLYVELTKNHTQALILSQCVFWGNKSSCSDGWFYKEYKEWFDEINVQERTMRRHLRKLEQKNLILVKVKKVYGVNKLHIKPLLENIIDSIHSTLSSDQPDTSTCTKVAPTGHIVRSEPDTLSDCIYTEENKQNTVVSERSSPAARSDSGVSPLDLASIFVDELPDSPGAVVNVVTKAIDQKSRRAITEFKKYWVARTGEPLTANRFRAYLRGLKEHCPGYLAEYTDKGGYKRKNGITSILSWETFEKYLSQDIY